MTQNGLTWLTFDLLSECSRLTHGVFLRHGGVSRGEFSSLNFSANQGDLPENVTENRLRALHTLALSQSVHLFQNHTNHVVEARFSPRMCKKCGLDNLISGVEVGDALISQTRGLGLMIFHADCQAALFYDPILHVLALAHSGWRGSVGNIYHETVEAMRSRYGSRPENLLVGISPSLGPLAAEFQNYRTELPEAFWLYQVKPAYFDFWEISRQQLIASGILAHHIEIAGLCTWSNPEDFFSYRRAKTSGRHATIAALL